jgi:hypothetical protein
MNKWGEASTPLSRGIGAIAYVSGCEHNAFWYGEAMKVCESAPDLAARSGITEERLLRAFIHEGSIAPTYHMRDLVTLEPSKPGALTERQSRSL